MFQHINNTSPAHTSAKRNSNVEILRIVIMFAILLWHVTVHGFGLARIQPGGTIDYQFLNSLCAALFVPCVNLFVLISGYYGIKLKSKTLVRFELQAIIYASAVYFTISLADHDFNVYYFIKDALFPVMGFRWWFLTTYIMLFILSPILNEGISRLTKKQHLAIIILFLIYNGIAHLLRLTICGYDLPSFIHIYIIGQFLFRYKDDYRLFHNRRIISTGILICLVINFVVVYACLTFGYKRSIYTTFINVYLGYSNPIIILQSVLIFCYVLSCRPTYNKNVNNIAKHVFAVYLITEAIRMPLYLYLKGMFLNNFLLGLALCLLVFAGCIIVEMVRAYFCNRLIDYAYNHISIKLRNV